MSMALLFSPQGSQVVGMGQELADASTAARAVFATADATLGWGVSTVAWEGPEDLLNDTRQTQPCLVATELAALAALQEALPALRPAFVAGHSVGEYAALAAAGVLSIEDALRLVARRALLMSEQGGGGMLAVIGLSRHVVAESIAMVGTPDRVIVANDNAPGQVVVSGQADALSDAAQALTAAGARRIIPLRVSGPFHSPAMAGAGGRLSEAFDDVTWRDATIPVVSNVTAQPERDAASIRALLARQVSSPVEWVASVERMRHAGVDTFVECGPGNALTGMVRRIVPDARTCSVSDPVTLAATVEALAAEAAAAGASV
ncbi:MAG TPA: ACP S-malonyltransferase [Candidatus Limnocylindria bacterium]|nr:ACP S-malonyltransferase [Candidatus Limnocylindria bacterium]